MNDTPPIACTLSLDELRARREGLLPGLASRATEVRPVKGGVELHFAASGDIVQTIAQVIDAERHCCRFLSFHLAVAANGGPIALTVTAPVDGERLLTEIIASESRESADG